jgi:hypothetical protein
MKSRIHPIMLTYLGVFLTACAAIFVYHYFFIWPQQTCEAHGDWWDERDRVCAVPMPIWAFTPRMPGEARPETPVAAPVKTVAAPVKGVKR